MLCKNTFKKLTLEKFIKQVQENNNKQSVNGKTWVEKKAPERIVELILQSSILKYKPTCKVAFNRGIKPQEIQSSINLKLKNTLPDPYILKDMEKACNVTLSHLQKQSKIAFFSDYDVDGMTSLACITDMFENFHSNFIPYIPNRYSEGYGLTVNAVKKLIALDVNLIICLDNGSTCHDAITHAKENNVDVIVIDHHAVQAKVPSADAFVNPKQIQDESGLDYMCAAGLTFLFTIALNRKLEQEGFYKQKGIKKLNLLNLLPYVALGTMCDIVPLQDVNRVLVKKGLEIIELVKPAFASSLASVCKIQGEITAQDLAFGFGPRINAPSRMGMAILSFNLLKEKSFEKAIVQANEIELINNKRKEREEEIASQAIVAIKHRNEDKNLPFVMQGSSNWEKGIIGIIASRIKDEYNKVAIIYYTSKETKQATASARSVLGIDIGNIICKLNNEGLLISGGGHLQAGGFSFELEKLEDIKKFIELEINKIKQKQPSQEVLVSTDYYDDALSLHQINEHLFDELSLLEPYGACFPSPLFILKNVTIDSYFILGKHKNHIKCMLSEIGNNFKYPALAFKVKGAKIEKTLIQQGIKIDVICGLSSSYYNGKRQISILIKDVIEN